MRYELHGLTELLVADERGVQIQTSDEIHFIPLDQLTAVDIEPPCLTHPGYIVLETSKCPSFSRTFFFRGDDTYANAQQLRRLYLRYRLKRAASRTPYNP